MTISKHVVKNIIRKLLAGDDYRIEVITLLNAEFLQYSVDFFKKVVNAKFENQGITPDWYKKEFLNEGLTSEEIAINSGLNRKTISNMYNSARREIVIAASNEHYDNLYAAIKSLLEEEGALNITLTIKFNNVSVDLDLGESLIVINTLAVKRSAIRGGLWSTAGKRVEKPLMHTLCKLFSVNDDYYKYVIKGDVNTENVADYEREIDFFLCKDEETFKCEVKLMGKGNPESADAVIARDSKVFVADKLSNTNKAQLNSLGVEWVELRSEQGYRRFKVVLENLGIPHQDFNGNLITRLEEIFSEIF